MAASAAGFAIETLAVLSTLGFGLCALAMPGEIVRPLAFAPVVGLAVAMLANQWLTWFVPAPAALMLVGVGAGGLSLVRAWRLRGGLAAVASPGWRSIAAVALLGPGAYLATLGFLFRTGGFTLADYPSDSLHLYAPAAQWFVGHAFRPGATVSIAHPIVSYLDSFASRTMPGSVGTLDAALSVTTGWPVHALFDPLNGLLLVLTAFAMAALARVGVGLSRGAAVIAFAAVMASSLLQWAVVSGYQQELESLPLLYGGLTLALVARWRRGVAPWMLAAATLAPLPGVYLPAAILALVLLVPAAVGAGVRRLVMRRGPLAPGAAVAAVTGLVLAAPSAGWLLVGGGLRIWLIAARPAPVGGVGGFYPLSYDAGTAPVTRFTLAGWPLAFWRPQWDQLAMVAAVVLAALAAIGLAVLVRRGRFLEATAVVSALAYLACLRLVVQGPYGFIKTLAYLAPVVMGLAAAGVTAAPALWRGVPASALGLLWPRALPAVARGVLGAALAGVVVLEAGAAAEVQAIASPMGGAMETSATDLTVLRSVVPHGASVLVYDPHDWTKASLRYLWRYEAALYALSGHANTRLIVEGPPPYPHREWYEEWTSGTGGTTLARHSDGFAFVLTGPEIAEQVPAAFRPVWMQADLHLELFERGGPT